MESLNETKRRKMEVSANWKVCCTFSKLCGGIDGANLTLLKSRYDS